jgi:digeranylgeranylglycerophospholipid reductase
MATKHDVIVAGGSVAGLTFASEAALRGLDVLLLEEHEEFGEPEKCDGLVSLRGLRMYGYGPIGKSIQSLVHTGVINAPGGRSISLDARALEVVVLDRSTYDKQIAQRAYERGAKLHNGERATKVRVEKGRVLVEAREQHEAQFFVDATGPSSSPREGILPAAKYEIEADWIEEGKVEVFLDQEKYPGFFAWVIPYGPGVAKVGASGFGINAFKALDGFLAGRSHKVLRRVAAPIYVGGPRESFVEGRKLYVGESAGQVKPTTAGGIMTSLSAAVIAAKWVADAIEAKDPSLVAKYEDDWNGRFQKEMRSMLRLRGVFEKLSNKDLDGVVSAVSSPKFVSKLSSSDFDFHATAVLSALGVLGVVKLAGIVASAEARQLLTGS